MSTSNTPAAALPFEFGGFTIPAGTRRIFITAELEPSNGDPRIQPTGFPDIGPVLYPDPAEKDGLICLIDGEAKVGQFLEEVCLDADAHKRAEGVFRKELQGLPYIKLTSNGKVDGEFVTATTIDGHRFASEYVMSAHFVDVSETMKKALEEQAAASATEKEDGTKSKPAKKASKKPAALKAEFVLWVRHLLGMKSKDRCPAANVPKIFKIVSEYDPMSLIHGFQISVKDKLTFVGLRSPRAITGSIVGLGCERLAVPGVRVDPVGTASASQAIFQKQRITAKKIQARFCIDVGLLTSMSLGDGDQGTARLNLILKIALCKVAWFLGEAQDGKRLRSECDLRVVKNGTKVWLNRIEGDGAAFNFQEIIDSAAARIAIDTDSTLGFPKENAPLTLKHVVSKKKTKDGDGEGSDEDDMEKPNGEEGGDE